MKTPQTNQEIIIWNALLKIDGFTLDERNKDLTLSEAIDEILRIAKTAIKQRLEA